LKKAFTILSAVLGIAAFIAIPFLVGIEPTIAAVARTGWLGILVFVANASLTSVAPAIGWWLIMRGEGIPASCWQSIKANLMGFPINFITPSAYLGGEPLRTVYIAKVTGVTKRRVLATIVVSKMQEFAALTFLGVVCAAIILVRFPMSPAQRLTVGIVTGALALFCGGVMIAFCFNAKPTVRIINLLARMRIARRRLARLRPKAEEMENLIHACFLHRWKRFLLAQAVVTLSAVSLFFRPWVYFIFDTHPELGTIGSEHLAAIYVVTNTVNTFSFTPGGLGVFEAGLVGYFSAAKLGADNAVAYALANRIFDVVYIILGVWLIAHTGLSSVAKGLAKGKDETLKPEDMPTADDV